MNAGFDQNEAELGVLVLAIALEMLADGDGLADTISKFVLGTLMVVVWVQTFLMSM